MIPHGVKYDCYSKYVALFTSSLGILTAHLPNISTNPVRNFSCRFLARPTWVIIVHYAIPKWVRQKIVNGVSIAISYAGHIFLLVRYVS